MKNVKPKDIFRHPLIRKILKSNITTPTVIHKMIVEELLNEAPINTISNKFTTTLNKIEDPIERMKVAYDWLKKLESGIQKKDLSDLFPKFKKLQPPQQQQYLEAAQQYLKTQQAGGPRTKMAALQAAIKSSGGSKTDVYQLMQTAAKEKVVPEDELAVVAKKVGINPEKIQPDAKDPSDANKEGVNVDVEGIKKKYNKLFELAAAIWDKPDKLEFNTKVLAFFLHYLIDNNVLAEFLSQATEAGIDKKLVKNAFKFALRNAAGENQEVTKNILTRLFTDKNWVKELQKSMAANADQPESEAEPPAPPEDSPVDQTQDANQDELVPTDQQEPTTDAEEEQLITSEPTPEQEQQEQQEVAQEIEQVTSQENLKKEFSDKSKAMTREKYDQAYINTLDEFFGQTDKPSFMKQILLEAQSIMLFNMIDILKDILEEEGVEGGGRERQAFSDAEEEEPSGTNKAQAKRQSDKKKPEQSMDEAKIADWWRDEKERARMKKEDPKAYAAMKKEMGLDDSPLEKTGKAAKAGMDKIKSAAKDTSDRISKAFSKDDNESKIKNEIPLDKKDKVSLKRELRALADILVKSKKVAESYDKYGTMVSYDPQFDGSSLEKSLDKILGHVQTHNARLVYIMREITEGYEQEVASKQLNEESPVDRDQKVKEIKDAFNDMGELYINSLRVSLGGEEGVANNRPKAMRAAKEMMDIAKERIIRYFPKVKVTSAGAVITLGQASKALNARIADYKRILRDIFNTVKDDAIAPAHISEMVESVAETCRTIQINFDVPCKIRNEDTQYLKKVLPTTPPAITDGEDEKEPETRKIGGDYATEKEKESDTIVTGGDYATEKDPDAPKQLTTTGGDEEDPDAPKQLTTTGGDDAPKQLTTTGGDEEDPDAPKQLTTTGGDEEDPTAPRQLTGPSGEKEKSPYYVSKKFDNAPLKQAYTDLKEKFKKKYKGGFDFQTDLQAWVDFFGPYVPKQFLDKKEIEEAARKRNNDSENISHIAGSNMFVKHKEEIKEKFKKLQQSSPLEADKIARMSFILSKQGKSVKDERGASMPNPFTKTALALFRSIRRRKPETEKEIEEALIRKLIPIINPMVRGYDG